MRFDLLYNNLAKRAVRNAEVDIETFVDNALALGMSPDAIEAEMLDDLMNSGPMFGKFLSNMTGASESAVLQAHRQGLMAGEVAEDKDLRELLTLNNLDIDAILDSGDPAELERLDVTVSEVVRQTWVAELVNTCHLCLPLHGVTLKASEWAERGLHPSTIHVSAGFNAPCHCRLVNAKNVDRSKEMNPLKRIPKKSTQGLKLGRDTVRAVTQKDIDKSIKAREKAMQSIVGRRTLRRAGQVNK